MKKAGRCCKEVGTWKKRIPQSFFLSSLKEGPSVCMKVKVTQLCPTLCNPMDYTCSPWNPPGQNTGVGSYSLLSLGLPYCRWILYQLSHQGSPRILEWVAYPSSRRSSPPRNQTRVSCIAGRFFTS